MRFRVIASSDDLSRWLIKAIDHIAIVIAPDQHAQILADALPNPNVSCHSKAIHKFSKFAGGP